MAKKVKDFTLGKLVQFKAFLKKVIEILNRPEMAVLPGQLAFFIFLSFVPIITLFGAIANMLGLSMHNLSSLINNVFPNMDINLTTATFDPSTMSISLILIFIVMFYIASNGANSLIITSNEIYGIKQSNILKRRLKAILMTILFVILFIFILIVPLLGTKILEAVDYFNLENYIMPLIPFVKGPLTWIIIFSVIRLIYSIAPDRLMPNARVYSGALFTTIGWIVATSIFSKFINYNTTYSIYYGSLSGIATLMLWVYILSFIFVIGMSLNYRAEKEKLEKTGTIVIEK